MRNKQNGSSSMLSNAFLVLIIAGWIGWDYFYVPQHNENLIKEISSKPPSLDLKDIARVEEYKKIETPKLLPSGYYDGKHSIDKKRFEIGYLFLNGRLHKESTFMDKYNLKGSAKYTIEGSIFVFSDIKGAVNLFALEGEPFEMKDNGDLILPNFYDVRLVPESHELSEDSLALNSK
jgi:hypothetical protein